MTTLLAAVSSAANAVGVDQGHGILLACIAGGFGVTIEFIRRQGEVRKQEFVRLCQLLSRHTHDPETGKAIAEIVE